MENSKAVALGASLIEKKKVLRTQVRKSLRSLDSLTSGNEDNAVQSQVLSSSWFTSSRMICAYISCESLKEVSTSSIVENILSHCHSGWQLFVPRVGEGKSQMRMLRIEDLKTDLFANKMNILEPSYTWPDGRQREDVLEVSEPLDLILLPGLAFDRNGRRLGRGGGYYDKFLEDYFKRVEAMSWKPPLLVALSYEAQVLESPLPAGDRDVSVDLIVTAKEVIDCRQDPSTH